VSREGGRVEERRKKGRGSMEPIVNLGGTENACHGCDDEPVKRVYLSVKKKRKRRGEKSQRCQ